MSTISGVGGASSAWSGFSTSRAGSMKEMMFAKADRSGDGSIDKTELKAALEKLAKDTGTTSADAAETLTKFDTDGDGSLNVDEMDAGMKSLMPSPSSTVDFAQQRGGPSGPGGPGGPGGPPPPPPPDDAESGRGVSSTDSASSSAANDPLDTNGDGTVSFSERAAVAMEDLIKALDTDEDGSVSKSEIQTFARQLEAFSKLSQSYGAFSSDAAANGGSASSMLSLAA